MGIVTISPEGRFDAGPPETNAVAAGWYPADVHLMLVRNGRLLFVRRAASGLWLLPSSGLHPGESLSDGACRTALEQVTVYVGQSDVHLAHVHRHEDGSGPRFGLFVQARQFRGVPIVTDRRVLDRLAWYPPAKMPQPAAPHVAAAVSAWDKRMLPIRTAPTLGGEPSRAGRIAGERGRNR